ncbi:hypothetical protein [Dokdonella fugitiva]|uniref:Uncharacterized protein n=1 Tax=Dokdonella fugitiva TaxID=328517 RepID=A0A4R2IAD9_9GAMM|nr:hypothetical protein [Dokdonella fugitiva]MBA8883682.1 hypothetical protein [Dokdonella fugitiva]TCO41424.1 hypothetical protein EV148_103344 [Dokdonella fugitiva]
MTERRHAPWWLVAAVLFAAAAPAQDRYAGRWTIARAEPAPWAAAGGAVDPAEVKRLVGQRVTFEAKRIRGPDPLGCTAPRYVVKDVPAEGLFQGGLAEYGDHAVDADTLATRLGFNGRPIATLDTGCEGAIDFHATGDDELLFALDNVIYRMHRDAARATRPRKTP